MVLNPTLYNALRRRFLTVRVVHEGEPAQVQRLRRLVPSASGLSVRWSEVPFCWGETYRLDCPYCGDHKGHLHVSHLWGTLDPVGGRYREHLAYCFRGGCLDRREMQDHFYMLVYGAAGASLGIVIPTIQAPAISALPEEARPPGELVPLTELDAAHPAVAYLRSRGFDPAKIGKRYGVCFCAGSSDYPRMAGRIAIPLRWSGITYGWQGRLVPGIRGMDRRGPKYWTLPGARKGEFGYSVEEAFRHQTVIVCEGPTDVWRVGEQACGLLGKSLSSGLIERMRRLLEAHWGPETTIVLLLDPDEDRVPRGRGHHIERAAATLRSALGLDYRGRILPVYLPEGDPGSTERSEIFRLIAKEAKRQGIAVSFGAASRARDARTAK